jgi:hypothetical protein
MPDVIRQRCVLARRRSETWVIVTGADGYGVAFAIAELDPAFTDRSASWLTAKTAARSRQTRCRFRSSSLTRSVPPGGFDRWSPSKCGPPPDDSTDAVSCTRQNVRPELNSEGEGNQVCFPHGITSHKRAVLPSLPRYDTAEHATQPSGLLPHLQRLQSHVARDRGDAARRKGTASFSFSSPHRLCHSNKLSRAPAHTFTGPRIQERGDGAVGHVREELRFWEV